MVWCAMQLHVGSTVVTGGTFRSRAAAACGLVDGLACAIAWGVVSGVERRGGEIGEIEVVIIVPQVILYEYKVLNISTWLD